jgi:Fe-S-cluster-containing hydrogenase component 2
MPASKEEIQEAEEEGVKIMYLVSPKEIKTKAGKVSSIVMVNHVLGESDSSGRRRPEPVEGTQFELKVDTVISALGQGVDIGDTKSVKMNKWGTIATDKDGFTGLKGIFAGGDASLGASTVIEAIACAKKSAAAIDKFLMKSKAVIRPVSEKEQVDMESVLARNGEDKRKWRVPLVLMPPEKRRKNFNLYIPVLSDKEAVEEAKRCYACGCGEGCSICHDICKMFAYHKEGAKVVLDEEKCVACGMCIWKCPNDNIRMIQTSKEPLPKNSSFDGKKAQVAAPLDCAVCATSA